ncbi:MAG: M1 family metallopeptidase [Rhodothermales bacterium]|nr:M1 family metallopeptidase [Rhodothermales bacterium]MBO6780259.1 M1 family metallopeptidase [Rhodothermales bacterium]
MPISLPAVAGLILLAGSHVAQAPAKTDVYPKDYRVDMLNYAFHLTLSDDTDRIEGRAVIDVAFRGAGVDSLRLDLTSVEGATGMAVAEVLWNGTTTGHRHEDNVLWVDVPGVSAEDQYGQFEVRYGGVPARGLLIGPNKHGDRTFFSDNWPNWARDWLPTVDHPYDKATNEFIVTAPGHYQIACNGIQIEETNLEGGRKLTHWKNSVPIATWLYALAAAEFAVQHVTDFRGVPIETWVYRQDRDAGFYDFAVPTPHAMEFFSDYVGPYAYERLANIQSNSVGGGMEAATNIFYGDRSVTGNREVRWRNIIIHEVAHQWFGNAVTESDWDDVWLSESFATYFTLLFREHAYGREDFVAGLKDHREGFRRWIAENGTEFRTIHDNLDPISRGTVTTYQITYLRGAWVLHMLRNLVGDESWWQGIRTYYAEFMNLNATTEDFMRHMEEASGMELQAFFDQWLRRGGHPDLEVVWARGRDGQLRVRVNQSSDFILPVEIGIYAPGSDTPEVFSLPVRPGASDHAVRYDGEIERVVVDPRTVLMANWTLRAR